MYCLHRPINDYVVVLRSPIRLNVGALIENLLYQLLMCKNLYYVVPERQHGFTIIFNKFRPVGRGGTVRLSHFPSIFPRDGMIPRIRDTGGSA